MTIPTTVLAHHLVPNRLAELGLSTAVLHEALRIGYGHAAGCTEHEPHSLPGTLVWGKGIAHLRDEMKVSAGWRPDSTSNYETVVHPSGTHGVALALGTSQTGRRNGHPPRTKTPKGPATMRVVEVNRQLSLASLADDQSAFGTDPADAAPTRETWLLLHFYDRTAGEIRCELSRPAVMEGKQVTGWSERILLEPVPFAENVEIPMDDLDADEIDIDVSRRAD
jgi:hypothetical protein